MYSTGGSSGAAAPAQPTTVEIPVISNFSSGSLGAFSAWQQVIAATAKAARRIVVTGNFSVNPGGGTVVIQVGVGPGGSESIIGQWRGLETATSGLVPFFMEICIVVPAASRVSIRASDNQGGGGVVTVSAAVNIEEA